MADLIPRDVLWTCNLCHAQVLGTVESLEHLRLLHPDQYGDGPQRWPDGELVVVDTTLEPDDFGGSDG